MNSERLPYLDGLRVAALALLIPYHVGMYYVSWGWHVKSPAASHTLEPFMMLTAPWRLGLLFFIAGAACQGLLARQGVWGTVKDRSRRLLLPLLFGMAVIVTPQAYYEVLTKAPQLLPGDGGYLDFWAAYLHGGKYCRGTDCMVVPTWNHLWFLPYLWLYAVLGAAWQALRVRWPGPGRPGRGGRAAWVLPESAPAWAWLLLPALPLAAARLFIEPWFPTTHALVDDPYSHVVFGYLFALGWASRTPSAAALWPQALRLRRPAALLALVGWALLAAYYASWHDAERLPAVRWAGRTVWGLMSWWALFAACGWAQRAFRQASPWLRAASQGVFCVYILHQTVIVLLTRVLLPLDLPWGAEAVALIALTAMVCLVAYAVLRRVPVLRELVGIYAPGRSRSSGTMAARAA